ncbi:hypothetical protein [Streptomyces tailanensis]|uniref:hypothetical protein n=1 Tax=Streptomyces tailanensis TaxID=2569858 RepID=UPI00122E871D|nr:hypothetical protein [Streptomyces tailanensis]
MKQTGRGKRVASVGAAASVLAAGLVLGVAAPQASAVDWDSFTYEVDGSVNVTVYNGSRVAGFGAWARDPGDLGSATGDTLIANDQLADGYGIEARLDTGRVATTRGHESPYTDRVTGDLREDVTHYITVCVVQGSFSKCFGTHAVKS